MNKKVAFSEVSYAFHESEDVLIRTFYTSVTMSEMIASWEEIISKNMLNEETKGVLSDFRQCKIEMEVSDLIRFGRFMKTHEAFFSGIKVAEVIDSPQIALPIIFKGRFNIAQLEVFSTKEKALDWICVKL